MKGSLPENHLYDKIETQANNTPAKAASSQIQYHPGFVSGMELLLWPYRSSLCFESEHYLSRQPIRMDLFILKKNNNVQLEPDIARIFRKYNVIEYKSPKDELSIDDFYKTIAYASLYKAEGSFVDQIPVTELTASLFRHVYPRELFKRLNSLGAEIARIYDGVYYIRRVVNFPVQIVVTGELDKKNIFRTQSIGSGCK